jgi:hypothetical protein
MDITWLVQGMWWGIVGLSYFVYGKRQDRIMAMTCGAALMIFPYFVDSNIWMFVIGVVLSFIPWRWRV